jgi:hypothetical protein
VLMDGGNNLNIFYAHTLWLMGTGLDQLRPSTTPFHGAAPGKRVRPLGQSRFGLARRTISARKLSPLRWWGLGARTMPFLDGRVTPSLWRSRTTPQDKDVRAERHHHRGIINRARIRLRRRVRGAR